MFIEKKCIYRFYSSSSQSYVKFVYVIYHKYYIINFSFSIKNNNIIETHRLNVKNELQDAFIIISLYEKIQLKIIIDK